MKNSILVNATIVLVAIFLNVCVISGIQSIPDTTKTNNNSKVFKAGAAMSNITPMLGGNVVGNIIQPSVFHIHDDLHARCLLLDDGSTQLVFVVVDVISIDRNIIDKAKELIHSETNLPIENILISSTHTHSAASPSSEDYQPFLIRRIADVVRIAMNNLEPARIGWGVGNVPQHVFNRRWKMKPGTLIPNPFGGHDQVKMWPGHVSTLLEPAGPTDPEVSFISVQSTQGRPIALLANYSLHYVGGVPPGNISADYFAVFADRMQQLLKADRQDPPFVGIMSNGTSADVISINFAVPAVKYQPYEKMLLVADDVAQEVLRIYKTIQHRDWVRLLAAQDELTLKVRKPDQKMIDYANIILAKPDTAKPYHYREKVTAERTIQAKNWPENYNILLQAFCIGELGVAAIPFETFAETGLEIKTRSPFKQSFTIGLANGSFGYLPTPEQHKLGGYETWMGTNRVEVEASRKIVSKLLELFEKMEKSLILSIT